MASEEAKPLTNGIDDGQSTARASQSQGVAAEIARPNNFQRIAQKKMMVKSFPRQKKLEKLAVYNSCKVCTTVIKNYNVHLVRTNLVTSNFIGLDPDLELYTA